MKPRTKRLSWRNASLLLAGAWLVFLFYPLHRIATSDQPTPLKIVGFALTGIFAVVYLTGLRTLGSYRSASQRPAQAIRFAALILIVLAASAIIGFGAVSFTPYLVAFAAYGLWRPWRQVAAIATVMTASALCLIEPNLIELAIIDTLIAVIGLVMITLIDHSADADELERENLVIAERDRMARDVHDLIGHSLTVVKLKAQLAERLVDSDPQRVKAELAEIQGIVGAALSGVRQTVTDARIPSLTDELGSARRTLEGAGIEVGVTGDAAVSGPMTTALGWVVREATTNVLRHAGARRCEFRLTASSLEIADDGQGPPAREGNGIRGMRERVAAAGGALRLDRSGLGGTLVEVTW